MQGLIATPSTIRYGTTYIYNTCPQRWGPNFPFLDNLPCTPAGWLALLMIKRTATAFTTDTLVSCMASTRCSADCIYQIEHKLCLPLLKCTIHTHTHTILCIIISTHITAIIYNTSSNNLSEKEFRLYTKLVIVELSIIFSITCSIWNK